MDEGNEESMQIQGYHNHPPEVMKRKSEQLEGSLRKRARTDLHLSLQAVYEEATAELLDSDDERDIDDIVEEVKDICKGLPSDYSLATTLRRARRKLLPVLPQSRATIDLANMPKASYVLIDHGAEDRIIVIGKKRSMIDLCASDRVHMDGTFRSAPNMFSQLFIIHALVDGHVCPMLYCLLPAKDTAVYTLLFRLICDKAREFGLEFRPDVVWVDYEAAITRSIRYVLRGTVIKGCYFHYCQALRRRYSREGLTNHVFHPGTVRTVVFRLMCLPFLPVEDIGPTFDIVSNPLGWDVLPHDVHLSLGRFVRYVQRMWIESAMGQERWNVWSTDIRTNNSVEAYNACLNAKLPPHPNVYQLVEFLSKEIKKTRIRLIMARLPGKKFRPQAKKQREKEARVDQAKDTYREGRVQAIQYLDQIVGIYHPVRVRPPPPPRWRRGGRAPAPRMDAAVDAVVAAAVGGAGGDDSEAEAESADDFSDPFEGEGEDDE